MTVEDVRAACQDLAAQGVQPSGNTLVHYVHTRGERLSKRTALAHLRALADAGEVFMPVRPEPPPPPGPVPAPVPAVRRPSAPALERRAPAVPPDPVAQAETALDAAREAMQVAALALSLVDGIMNNGQRFGHLMTDDPARPALRQAAKEADFAYRCAWQALEAARQSQAQRQAAERQTLAHQWVQDHAPAVVQELARAQSTFRRVQALPETPDKFRAFSTARYALQQAHLAYSQALGQAPTTNGSTP